MSAEEATFQNMQSEDATSSLNEQLSPEAESISRVLVNCISQVKIAASLPAILQFYSKSGVLDQDLSRALQTHQVLAERLEMLGGQQQNQTKKEKRKIVLLKNDVKNSVRDMLRYFRIHPVVLSGLQAELNEEVGESESMLTEMLEKFHDRTIKKLISGPDENTHKLLQRQRVSASGKGLHDFNPTETKVVQTLKQLDNLERLEEQLFNKHSTMVNLQNYLDVLEIRWKKRLALLKKQDEPKSSPKLTSLNQENDQLNTQLNNLMTENQQTQRILREENEMLEMKRESLLQTFDEDMEKLQAELEGLEKEYEKEQEDVMMLQESFSLLEVQSNEIQERRRLAEETRKEELRLLERKTNAAVVIQTWWRGYSSVRKALKNKDKSKKGKKGKQGIKSKKSNIKGNSKKNK